MTQAQQAYESDVKAHPLYHDGTPRPTWHALRPHARETWETAEPPTRDSNRMWLDFTTTRNPAR